MMTNRCFIFELAILVLFSGCSSNTVTLSIPFSYEGLGVGGNSVQDGVVLPVDAESDFVSQAIVQALQELEYSVLEPQVELGSPLPQGERFATDTVPVDAALIAEHNREHDEMSLPRRFYTLRYRGAYRLVGRDLVFELSAELFERAAGTLARPYADHYSGNFFVLPLFETIKTKLLALSGEDHE